MKELWNFSYFLGLEIIHSTYDPYISQAKYASELLSWAGLTNSKTIDTLVELNVQLTPLARKPLSNPSLYNLLVGSPVYLTITRWDISYVVHYASVLCILRYMKDFIFHSLFTLLSLLLFSMLSLIPIGQEISLIEVQPLVIAFFLVLLWFLGETRNKPLWPAPVLKWTIVPL